MQKNKTSLIYIVLVFFIALLGLFLSFYVLFCKDQQKAVPVANAPSYRVVPPGPLGGSVVPFNKDVAIQEMPADIVPMDGQPSVESRTDENIELTLDTATSTYKDVENLLTFDYPLSNPPVVLKDSEPIEVFATRSFIVKITTNSNEIAKLADLTNKGPNSSDMEENINDIGYRVLSHGEGAAGSTYVETYFIAHLNNKYYIFGFLDRYCNFCEYESDAERDAVHDQIDERKYSIMKTVYID